MSSLIKVSVIEDDARWRRTLQTSLAGAPGFCCVSAHPNAEHALRHLSAAAPDVALVDIQLPRQSGIECVSELRRQMPRLLVMMLTEFDDADRLFGALQAGAQGYLLKSTAPAEVLNSIVQLHAGGSPMTPEIARKVLNHFRRPDLRPPALDKLTPRELQVAKEITGGARIKEVADALGISVATAQSHVRHIYEKLHISTRAEMATAYLKIEG
jgi:DNA-binding NarL/FixJ family response regulator